MQYISCLFVVALTGRFKGRNKLLFGFDILSDFSRPSTQARLLPTRFTEHVESGLFH